MGDRKRACCPGRDTYTASGSDTAKTVEVIQIVDALPDNAGSRR